VGTNEAPKLLSLSQMNSTQKGEKSAMYSPSKTEVQTAITKYIDELAQPLRELNRKVGIKI